MDAQAVRCWVQERHAQLHMRKWMLEFDDADPEREFRAHDDANGLRAATFAQVVGVLFTVVYAGVDFLVLHGFVPGALIVRVVTIAIFLLGIVAIRRIRTLQDHLQVAAVVQLTIVQVLLVPVLAGIGDFPTQYLMTSATVTLLGAVGLLRLRMHAALANTVVFVVVCLELPNARGNLNELGTMAPQIAGLAAISVLIAYALERLRRIDFLRQREIERERARTEEILYNVLPAPIADRLRDGALTIADSAPSVSVLFSDIVGFTPLSETLTPEELVQLLDTMFRAFDELCDRRGIEKIKTVGDAYMAVAGLPNPDADHAASMAELALDMQRTVTGLSSSWPSPISMRIGISSGPVVAGVIGQRKFIYDLWGDTVNTASRMESSGRPHRIQVSASTHALLAHRYAFSDPQVVEVKGKGRMTTYFLEGAR
ncbi:adenylate/guanylate cyclase domain-containing protein [Mycobacterium sp. SMC-17]|uniref:adenylate/guanylate cyclase domain-containing protein n=1 Tax=Mycobacterium sp. SMC-17 TaxID=3381628 RepID=UPI0038762A35